MGRTQGKNPERTCQGFKRDGSPCTAYALNDSTLCRIHDPRTRDEALGKLQEGKARWLADPSRPSKKSMPRAWDVAKFLGRKPIDGILESVPTIRSGVDLVQYVCEIAPLLITGKVPAERIGAIKLLIDTWVRLFSGQGIGIPRVPGSGYDGEMGDSDQDVPPIQMPRNDTNAPEIDLKDIVRESRDEDSDGADDGGVGVEGAPDSP